VGIHATTRYDVLQSLVALAADSPELRASLPLGIDAADAQSLQPDLDALVKALTDRLGRASAADAADAVRRRIARTTRPEPVRPLAQSEAAASVTGLSVVRLRRHTHPRLSDLDDGQVRVTTTTRSVTVPAPCRAALEVLVDGGPVAVGELPGLSEADACALIARLLREALVVPG
jgi:hypothetical protein